MITIDRDGLTLCKIQADLFEKSLKYVNTSSSIFIRRFMNSNIAREFDSKDILNNTKSIETIYCELEEEYGKSDYGTKKYNSEAMFWTGYIYRYFSYTYEISTKQAYNLIKPNELITRYYVYHTFDPAFAINRILEEKNISFDNETLNLKLLKLIRKRNYRDKLVLSLISKDLTNDIFSEFSNENYFKYDLSNIIKDSIILGIIYDDVAIGCISLKKLNNNKVELFIILKNYRFRNKAIGTVAIDKSFKYIKTELHCNKVFVSLMRNDEKSIHFFKKLGFKYFNEDDKYLFYEKNI